MKFTSTFLAAALATMACAAPIPQPQDANASDGVDVVADGDNGRVDWHSTDGQNRVIHCTPNAGLPEIPEIDLPAGQTVTTYFPEHWIGNCWGVIEGQENTGTGMLAEMNFNDWLDMTYFDVSAIVVPDDTDNVYAMVPGSGDTPMSGCWTGVADHSCDDNIYTFPDAVQTKVTPENYLHVYLGPNGGDNPVSKRAEAKREVAAVGRAFVEGRA